jgi:hypothetical protein
MCPLRKMRDGPTVLVLRALLYSRYQIDPIPCLTAFWSFGSTAGIHIWSACIHSLLVVRRRYLAGDSPLAHQHWKDGSRHAGVETFRDKLIHHLIFHRIEKLLPLA